MLLPAVLAHSGSSDDLVLNNTTTDQTKIVIAQLIRRTPPLTTLHLQTKTNYSRLTTNGDIPPATIAIAPFPLS